MNVGDVLIPVFSILLVVVLTLLVLTPIIIVLLYFKGYRFRSKKYPDGRRW